MTTDPSLASVYQLHEPEELARQAVNLILLHAVRDRASDIHFDPIDDGGGTIRYRVDGRLLEMMPPPRHAFDPIVRRLKAMAAIDDATPDLPQDGRIILTVNDRQVDLRLSVVPTFRGERAVLRMLDRSMAIVRFDQLGLADDTREQVLALVRRPMGLVVVTGPTGSGKTTVLYGLLLQHDLKSTSAITIEDPVEFSLPNVAQVQIKPQAGLTMQRAMRAVLRQAPDVIMVGELRDLETTELSIQAALTGHHVMSTLHASTAPGALRRLIDFSVEPYRVNAAVAGVIACRLVRRLCPQCRRRIDPPTHRMPPEYVDRVVTPAATFYEPAKCDQCNQTGFRGRSALYELLTIDDTVRDAVRTAPDASGIRAAALQSGMKPFLLDALQKAAQGLTSLDEVIRTVPVATEV